MTEYSNSGRGQIFPVEWGMPIGAPHSEERAAWVKQMVLRHSALTAHDKLARANGRLLSILRAAEMKKREEGPR